MAEKVTTMVLKVDLQCSSCYKKIKKILSKFPQIQDQIYDEKQNTVTIVVVCCSPEKVRDKLCCKGGKTIKCIEIKEPPKPQPPGKSKEPKNPKNPLQKPRDPDRPPDSPKKEPPKKEPVQKPRDPDRPPDSPKKEPPKKEPEKTPTKPPKPKEPPPCPPTFVPVFVPAFVPVCYPPRYSVGICCGQCYGGRTVGHVVMGMEGQCHPVIIMDVGLVVVVVVGIGIVTLVSVIILVKKTPQDAQSCDASALSCPRFFIPLLKKCSISFWVYVGFLYRGFYIYIGTKKDQ